MESKPRRNPDDSSSAASLAWVIRALRKSWFLIVAAIILSGTAALGYSRLLPKVYEATSLVEFVPDVVRPMGNKDDSARFWGMFIDNREYYETQYALFTSDLVIGQVVRDLRLDTSAEFIGRPVDKPIPIEDAIAMVRDRVKIEPIRTSRLVTVRCEDVQPSVAMTLCDAVAKAYVRQNREKQVKGTADAAKWLGEQLELFRGELETDENQLHQFKKVNDLPSSTPEEVSKMIRLEMEHYDEALSRTRTRRQELAARVAELSKVDETNPDQLPASEFLSSAFLSTLRTQYQSAVRERRELFGSGVGEKNPLMTKADEKVSQSRHDLLEEIHNIQGSIKRDLAILDRQEGGESGLYEGARKRAVELNLKELEYHRLDRQRIQNEKLYNVLLDQMKEADLARMMNVETVRVVDHAVVPKVPIRPKVMSNVGVGLAIGLLIGIGLALLREQLDSSIKSPEDVEQTLDTAFLGLIPSLEPNTATVKGLAVAKGRKSPRRNMPLTLPIELVAHERPLSAIAEAARTVRTNLIFMNPDKPPRILLVTSAAPAEGKTTVACSIAITIAQSGLRVCIVDCDLRRPRLHRVFDRVGDGGVTNVLVGDSTIEEVALPTTVPNLFCMPSGPIPPNPADVLQSEKFKEMLFELGKRFDRVVIDSPPVAAVADSAIISTLVDGVVLVVRAFATNGGLVKQGLRSLEDVDAPVLGVVLNDVDLAKQQNYYQYYYYKREGYGQRDHGAGHANEDAATDEPETPNAA